jgi:hypothetical protein
MKTGIRVTLRLGAGIFALIALSAEQTYAQGNNPNAYPNPYQLQENWAKLPPGRTWGSTIGIEIDPDGKSLWTFDRCAALNCRGSTLDPIMKFDPNGVMQIKFGSGLVNDPHGFHVDREGNVWVSDTVAENGKGQTVIKFSKEGKVLMTLGTPGVTGDANSTDAFDQPTDIYVALNGDIFVSQGHGARPTDRILKFSKDGKFIKSWGKRGNGPGEFDTPHHWLWIRQAACSSLIGSTIAYRSLIRTEHSSRNGNSSVARVGYISIGTTISIRPTISRATRTARSTPASRRAFASAAQKTARWRPSFPKLRLTPTCRKALPRTRRASSMAVGPVT